MPDEPTSPWVNGHSIEVLREVSAGLIASALDFTATPVTMGEVKAEWVVAKGVADSAPVVLYFHGGAYLCGTPAQYRNATVSLSRAANVRVLSVDYRLGPEHPFPAAFEDGLAIYRALLVNERVEPQRLVVCGDSAGASLAVSLVADALQEGLAPPSCIIANSPFVDLATASPSLDDPLRNEQEPNKQTIQWLATTYLEASPGVAPRDPRHSPVYRDLSGLPPLLVQTAGQDNLQHDGIRLAGQARACGVDTCYTDYPASPHIWIVLDPMENSPDAYAAMQEMTSFITKHLVS